MKRLLTVLVTGTTMAALAAPASATHTWGGYHWARTSTTPFTVKVGDNVTSDWDAHLNTANADWNAADALNIAPVAGTAGKRCSMTAGTVQVCNGKYGNNGWLGLATINITGGVHITQGSSKMNDTYFAAGTYNTPNERLHVMCQEVGHTFGLGHQSVDGSSQNTCMDYYSNTGANATSTLSLHPNTHDYALLSQIYNHADGSTTLAAAPSSSPGMAGQPGAQPYRSERIDHANHSQLREYFADDTARITDVRWVSTPRTVIDRD